MVGWSGLGDSWSNRPQSATLGRRSRSVRVAESGMLTGIISIGRASGTDRRSSGGLRSVCCRRVGHVRGKAAARGPRLPMCSAASEGRRWPANGGTWLRQRLKRSTLFRTAESSSRQIAGRDSCGRGRRGVPQVVLSVVGVGERATARRSDGGEVGKAVSVGDYPTGWRGSERVGGEEVCPAGADRSMPVCEAPNAATDTGKCGPLTIKRVDPGSED